MDAEQLTNYTAADYYEMTEERIELIEGVIYDQASPNRRHQDISGELFADIKSYIRSKGGKCRVYAAPFDVQLSEDTVVVPDISVICDPDKLTKQGCTGAPDWIKVITFLSRNKCLLISWLQSPPAVILEPRKITPATVSTVSPSICHEVMGPDAMTLVF